MVIELLQHALCAEWPDAEVRSFGSQDTKLYLPQGDIDLVVLSRSMDSRPREVTLRSMAACLRAHKLATDIQVIARAKVPIIKFVCPLGHFNVDISINQANGLQTARFVNRWLAHQPAIRPLVMVVKQLLQQRALSEVFTGGLGSYSVTLLVLSFLQVHPKLQRDEITAERNLGTLLMEFLELYGKNFGYDECGISVRGDGSYFSKRQRGMFDSRKPFMLCIEDPHDIGTWSQLKALTAGNNIAMGSFAIISVRSALGGAFDILQAALCQRANELYEFRQRQRKLRVEQRQRTHTHFDPDESNDRLHIISEAKNEESLLGSVLGVSREMIRRRSEIKSLYESGEVQQLLAEKRPALTDSASQLSRADIASASQLNVSDLSKNDSDADDSSDDTSHIVHMATAPPKRRRIDDATADTSGESRYARSSRTRVRPARDLWSQPAPQTAKDSESDSELVAEDAPFVAESSDTDARHASLSDSDDAELSQPMASTPAKRAPRLNIQGTGLSIAGRAERAKTLNKADRHAFWQAKAAPLSRS